ncbi:sortase-associated OmpA-like protein PdsO [Aliiglaciecola sp. LCG003]|uniref:sortase-associated OmpA-like protein PdsO n=1 Tax=Aliiglaciecola sp. LCG003 TaxID=3053655 RepID=UPI0025740734|nr:sortase-associated OmpA-like protein PdsO [Aliiglaciecola sp. LCG003]WJG09156.1 sortase-associated OmpA-like protein PdsO [Aliiglaciecola sp. LCG003]
MKKRIILPLTLLALSLSTSSFASSASKEEQTNQMFGFGSGAAAGALVGGPVGAIVGGIMGILIAEDVNNDEKLDSAAVELAQTHAQLSRRDSQLVALQQQYEQAQSASQMQLVAMDHEIERVMQDIESNIQFRTGSYVLEEHFKGQLDLVAKGLNGNPKLQVTLTGFADARGDDVYNQGLSQQRVLSVKSYLEGKGVNGKRVLTYAIGEAQPVSAQSSNEDFFFDRRVLVRIAQGQVSMTAANQ